jgi:hypothetical protein
LPLAQIDALERRIQHRTALIAYVLAAEQRNGRTLPVGAALGELLADIAEAARAIVAIVRPLAAPRRACRFRSQRPEACCARHASRSTCRRFQPATVRHLVLSDRRYHPPSDTVIRLRHVTLSRHCRSTAAPAAAQTRDFSPVHVTASPGTFYALGEENGTRRGLQMAARGAGRRS